ncbi:transporter substrate-binding domain-containing protein [Enterobacteriaceae bacterium YMB-R22]|uniref:ATP-binding protein n=1 Tax=Tenebrionicola larvae TaxID=2815733 RepID=UPI0020119196|nr:transporter substrate-binding domain-containing protein [Tenebrionicola larvae]MBV4413874.1 transporter substrate-binding domain-containing protein [Tenebrionicola larvae]
MRAFWLAILCLFTLHVYAAQEPVKLQLLSRSTEELKDPGLSAEQWRWLREHRKLRFAVWQPMLPPYDITTGLNDYGGINADFVGLLSENLGVEIEVSRYWSYDGALAALRDGSADFIAQASDNEKRHGLLLSKPYSKNTAVEVVNNDAAVSGDAVKRLALYPVYDRDRVLARYPHATELVFSSARHAMESLAFRKIDLFFCDAITARYLVSQSNLSNLSIRPVSPAFKSSGFSFAAPERMRAWIEILDVVLGELPESISVEIHRRWSGGIPLSLSEQQPMFTTLERKWIEENPRIRVAVAEDNAPVAFFDEQGQLHGTIADILTALRLRTGFHFVIQRYPSQAAAFAAVQNGKSELVAGGTQEGIWQANLLTTRTWLYNSWVMVGRHNHQRGVLTQRVVSLRGEAPEAWLKRQGIGQIEHADTWHEGLSRVARGESDMMIVPLIVANAQLTQKAFSSLKILASLDADPMRFAFGASRQAWPLITILNKALINIPPEDLHALTRSGFSNNSFASASREDNYNLYFIMAALVICGAVGFWLWRQRWRRLMRIMDAVPAPVYACDRNGRLLVGNAALRQALGVDASQLCGTMLETWLSDARPGAQTITHNGKRLRLWRAPVAGRGWQLGGWLDITRQRAIITALRQAKRRSDGASREKSTFLATMSHEIRTPISAVVGMLELVMQRGGDTEENRQSIRIAREAAQSLLLLIGNILDVARIESGRLVLRPERAALRELIESAAMMFDALAAKKGLQFALEIDAELNVDVLVDAMRLRQIIINLLGNAIKFTDSGSVTLRARPQWHEGDRMMLCLEVEDTGEGIDEALQARLFRPFEQGENNRMSQGSGLGLYISRTLAQMMGGGIALQSSPGEGTLLTVTLALPVMEPLLPTERAHMPVAEGGRRALDILVVDDNPAGRLLLSQQLSWLGHRPLSCSGGEEALAHLAHTHVDMVISDCNMPGMSGYTLAQEIRRRWPALSLYGVTADARESVHDEARAAGMTDCLLKPVSLAALEALLVRLPVAQSDEAPSARDESDAAISGVQAMRCGAEPASDMETPNAALPPDAKASVETLPAALLEGDNLKTFLMLQIAVIDDTLAVIAQWHANAQTPLREALHRLRGGIQLIGATTLEARCRELEIREDSAGVVWLEQALRRLRSALQQWGETGLQPPQNVLRCDEDETVS